MAENKIKCDLKPGYLEVYMTAEVALEVRGFIKGFEAYAKYTAGGKSMDYCCAKDIAEEFLEDPQLFEKINNEKFLEDEGEVSGAIVFLKRVKSKIKI